MSQLPRQNTVSSNRWEYPINNVCATEDAVLDTIDEDVKVTWAIADVVDDALTPRGETSKTWWKRSCPNLDCHGARLSTFGLCDPPRPIMERLGSYRVLRTSLREQVK